MVRGAAVCVCLGALIGGGAGARPNLVESALSFSQHGASLRVADVVRNLGAHTAPASTTGDSLGRVRIGGRAVAGPRPRMEARGSVALTLPRTSRERSSCGRPSIVSTLGTRGTRTMEIGKPRRTVTVEPVEDPVPRELPEELPEKEPAEAPREPEKIPA
jgi:hypothetical protein